MGRRGSSWHRIDHGGRKKSSFVDEKYKVEVIYREDDFYQIETFRLESDEHPIQGITYYWSPISTENILTDTLEIAIKLAGEHLKEISNS